MKQTASAILRAIRTKKSTFWEKQRERNALTLFHDAAIRVPAYKDFLRKNKINPRAIHSWKDFEKVPPTNKKDYLRQYPLEQLHWNGSLKRPLVFTATSGSTGEPFYFSRTKELDWQYSVLAELFLQNSSYGTKGPTLVLICFGMGVWIGGLITYKAFEMASQRGYSVSILTPGINKEEIFHALRKVAPYFSQTILVGYPPFIKDLVDEMPAVGIDLTKLHIRMLFAAESFDEHFRDYLVKKAGIADACKDTLNIYGTADIGAMAFETPGAIFIRRKAMTDMKIFQALFGQTIKTPTLAQYNPFFISFEATTDEEILLTGNNSIPLVRYAVGDHGGTYSFEHLSSKMRGQGIELPNGSYQLPFVYVYERSDFSTKLYGAIIYPEHVRQALEDSQLQKYVTGKFAMQTKHNSSHTQYLEIHVEMKRMAVKSRTLAQKIQKRIIDHLRAKNAEYRNNYAMIPNKVSPKILLWPLGDARYFKTGIKQKWLVK